jgi:hypothetical protein
LNSWIWETGDGNPHCSILKHLQEAVFCLVCLCRETRFDQILPLAALFHPSKPSPPPSYRICHATCSSDCRCDCVHTYLTSPRLTYVPKKRHKHLLRHTLSGSHLTSQRNVFTISGCLRAGQAQEIRVQPCRQRRA